MSDVFNNLGIIILAAGRGKRLNIKDIPKVLLPIGGKPIISYVLDELSKGGIPKEQITLVVGYKHKEVKKNFGFEYNYAVQKELLGTAHAAYTGEKIIPSKVNRILIIQGDDSAFLSFSTLENFIKGHINNDVSLLTCEAEDPSDLGRVIRDSEGNIKEILEKEQINEDQQKIKEINTNIFCFDRGWFREHYQNLEKIPGLGELGLPSFIKEAVKTKTKLRAYKLDNPNEWFGINTQEQLEEADRRKILVQN